MSDTEATTDEPPAALLEPSSPTQRMAFSVLNASTAPIWLAMILFPNAALTAWLVRRCTWVFAGLGVAYSGLLVKGMVESGTAIDFRDPDALRGALTSPDAFLAGWTHYLAFDLFVGRWIWEANRSAGRTARLPLLLTWWFGPVGLTLELARRTRRGR